ncbi:MAG: hypothetical protein ABIM99_04930 [Candidatus Dojkabacteria bacterium]
MRYLFVAPNLTQPTFETLQEVSFKMFKKVEEILNKINKAECTIKISVSKEGHGNVYRLNVEVLDFKSEKPLVIIKDHDLRKAIGTAASKLKTQIVNRRKKMIG